MASALQCPACGFKHRLSGLTGDPVFSCEQCGRLLKTPVEYRRPEPSMQSAGPPSNGSSRVQRGGSAARDQTSVMRATGAPAAASAAAGAPAPPRRSAPRPPATMAIPLQILGWVVAVLLGGIIVRYLAKWTGLVTGDSIIDILTGTGWGRYLRVFALVPFWALATAGLMTGFTEGAKWWSARRRTMPSGRPVPPRRAAPPAPRPKPPAASSPPPARTQPQAPVPDPAPAPAPAPAPQPAPAETSAPASAGDAPRTRRIPKRDISS